MSGVITIDYEEKAEENLDRALVRRRFNTAINKALEEHDTAAIFLLETPAENYLDANIASVSSLLKNGFEGIYLSFQRPFKNISTLFERNDIDIQKLIVIDGATAIAGKINEKNPRCVQLSRGFEVDDISENIFLSLPRLKSKNRFVFVDSLTTLSLYEPLSKAMNLPKYLMNKMEKNEIRNVVLFFNVAEDLVDKNYIENVCIYADEHIHLGLCT